MSEKEAIERGLLKPEQATKPIKQEIRYIRVPVIERRTKYKVVGPGIWHVVVLVLGWLLGFSMATHNIP